MKKERERERECEKKRKNGCVTTLKKMPATRTKIKMITYPTANVRALRVTHTHTRRIGGAAEGREEEGVGVCRDARPLPRCFVI